MLGKLGQGKSALVKTLLWRMLLFGRRAFVLDVKREYGPLCDAVGVKPVSLAPGGGVRLNPLAARPEEHAQLDLLRAVADDGDRRPADPGGGGARYARRCAPLRAAGPASRRCPQIASVLFDPPAEMAGATPDRRRSRSRRRAPRGARAPGPVRRAAPGMFDGPTTPGLDLDARLLVLDLHAVKDSPAVGILMACATAWMSAQLARMPSAPAARG